MPEKVAVIGAGIGGIAVAARLAAKGYDVSVFEKNDRPGGKISEIRHGGFRFDTGPSLFTQPQRVIELFEIAGEDASDHFDFISLDVVCRYFYDDGMVINAFANAKEFAAELQSKAGEDPAMVLRYLDESRQVFEFTEPVFISNSLHLPGNYFSLDALKGLLLSYKLKPFTTLHQLNASCFRHRNTISLFDRFATYNGSDPFQTPATLRVISHLEHNTGAYFPKNGMIDITKSLVALCERMGVKFLNDSKVEEIIIENDRVKRLIVNGSETGEFDHVVSDIDIWYLYKKLLKSRPFPEKWFRHERSTSALIFYWGMDIVSPGFDLHNIIFSGDYRQEFSCLFDTKTMYDDPTIYIFISSKVVKADAPEGCENWFVMVNTPENTGQDWDKIILNVRNTIGEKIKKLTGIDVAVHRKFEFVLDPRGIEHKTASYHGSLYGNSSNSVWAAFTRHPNFSKIKGLYYTGGSVHPGGGIPLCLSSAKIVSGLFPFKNKKHI
jgi:phytoene desaturase